MSSSDHKQPLPIPSPTEAPIGDRPIAVAKRLHEGKRVRFVIKDEPGDFTGRVRGFLPPHFYIIELDRRIKDYPHSCLIQPAKALSDFVEDNALLHGMADDPNLAAVLGSFLPIPKTAKKTLTGAINIFLDGLPICLPASEKYCFPGESAARAAWKWHLLNLFKKYQRSGLTIASNLHAEIERITLFLLTTGRLEYRSAVIMPSQSELEQNSKRDFWKERNTSQVAQTAKPREETMRLEDRAQLEKWPRWKLSMERRRATLQRRAVAIARIRQFGGDGGNVSGSDDEKK